MILAVGHSGKSTTVETVKRSVVARVLGEREGLIGGIRKF